jgi:hypothetical protein
MDAIAGLKDIVCAVNKYTLEMLTEKKGEGDVWEGDDEAGSSIHRGGEETGGSPRTTAP